MNALNVTCRIGHLEGLRIEPRQSVNGVDFLQGSAHGLFALHVRRYIYGPELPAYAACAQTRNVSHQPGLRLIEINTGQVASKLLPQRPRQVIMPVDERPALVQSSRPV